MQNSQKMNTKSFIKLLLPTLGYMVMGNVMSLIMSVSLRSTTPNFLAAVAILFSAMIYLILVAVPGYKDGQEEHIKTKQDSAPPATVSKKWLLVGGALFAVMNVTIVFFLLGEVWLYSMLNGATFQLTWLIKPQYIPFVNMGFYALSVPACHIGYLLGLKDKLSKDKMLYK
jgi:hypothetical protein